MTDMALAQGMALLFVLWPHRAESSEGVAALRSIYQDTLGELSDEAFIGACKTACKTCKHFPMPAELYEMALDYAEAASTERIRLASVARNQEIADMDRRMLTEGRMTEEQVAENQRRYDEMVAATLKGLRAHNPGPRRDGDATWRHEDRAYGTQRIADGHWKVEGEDEDA